MVQGTSELSCAELLSSYSSILLARERRLMSWLQALERVCRQTTLRRKRPTTSAACGAPTLAGGDVAAGETQGEASCSTSTSTTALRYASGPWHRALQLSGFPQPGMLRCDALLVHRLPLPLAARCVSILLEAGHWQVALDLLRVWQPPQKEDLGSVADRVHRRSVSPAGRTKRARRRASRHLRRSLKILGTTGDVCTLRKFLSALHYTLIGHRRQRDPSSHTSWQSSLNHFSEAVTHGERSSYRFLSSLGMQHTRWLAVEVAHALVAQDEGVVPLCKKLEYIHAVTIAVALPDTQPPYRIPFQLQEDFKKYIETSTTYDEDLLLHFDPVFASGFLLASQCSSLQLLYIPRSEFRFLQRNGRSKYLRPICAVLELSCFQPSALLQNSAQVELLVSMICSPLKTGASAYQAVRKVSDLTAEERQLRRSIWNQLRSPRSRTRRLWCRALLRHPNVLCKLGLSPLMVFGVCVLTFRSRSACSSFIYCCLLLLRRLWKLGREDDAARLVWNHLSHNSSTLARVCTRRPLTAEVAVTVVCRVMLRGIGGCREAWMGHRSLAVLRIVASAGKLTPAMTIPTCAAALDCGLHFATVQQHVAETYAGNNSVSQWVLNMVRLLADSQAVRVWVPLGRLCRSPRICRVTTQPAGDVCSTVPTVVAVFAPSRSKLLALWTLVNSDTLTYSLRRLVCQLFLDANARADFRVMHDVDVISVSKGSCVERSSWAVTSQEELEFTVSSLFRSEVLASVAANCTTEHSFSIFLAALRSQRGSGITGQCTLLALSEGCDEHSKGIISSFP
ncbi:hypothetical protein TRVL_09326 [Trypanosoma vivax]|nr:hypothetical protein TRVL_09326 [Trypanosoma vivax]